MDPEWFDSQGLSAEIPKLPALQGLEGRLLIPAC